MQGADNQPSSREMMREISAIDIFSSPTPASPILAISLWTNEILLYTLESFRSSHAPARSISEAFFATALQLKMSNATTEIQLMAGLSDGSLVVYDIESSDAGLSVRGRKVSSLGTRPLLLCPVSLDQGDEQVVAIGLSERTSVIFESKDRIEFSSVNKKVSQKHVDRSDETGCDRRRCHQNGHPWRLPCFHDPVWSVTCQDQQPQEAVRSNARYS